MGDLRAATVLLGWLAGWWLLARPKSVVVSSGGSPRTPTPASLARSISLIVPARNEARTLPGLLASLGPDVARVTVVDDASGDGTATVACAAGARVVATPPLPGGWAGKAWACQTGVEATTGELLVFVDADVRFAEHGLAAVVAEQGGSGGLVSVQPWHACERAVESLSAVFNVVALMGVGSFGGSRKRRAPAGAFGPVLACSRDAYLAVGGHRAVRGDILDDVGLAKRFSSTGEPVTCLMGSRAVSFRMYPEGLSQLIEGWTKNIAKGAGVSTRPATLALIVLWFAALSSVGVGTPVALGSGRSAVDCAAYVVAYFACLVQIRWMLKMAGRFRWWAWAAWPVPVSFFLIVFVRSLLLVVTRRSVRWKGRRLPTAP